VKDHLHKSALRLSGGQQRLCIARALAVKPKVLLMDKLASVLNPIDEDWGTDPHIAPAGVDDRDRYAQYAASLSRLWLHGFFQMVEFGSTAQIFTAATHPRTRDYVEGRFG